MAETALKVLVVDDDVTSLRSLARVLKTFGWTVRTSPDASCTPDVDEVLLTDWDPLGPTMVGVAQAIGVPVLIYTGNPDMVPPTLCVPILPKPTSNERIDEALRALRG